MGVGGDGSAGLHLSGLMAAVCVCVGAGTETGERAEFRLGLGLNACFSGWFCRLILPEVGRRQRSG